MLDGTGGRNFDHMLARVLLLDGKQNVNRPDVTTDEMGFLKVEQVLDVFIIFILPWLPRSVRLRS